MDKDLPERRARQEDMIKTAFGKTETFAEYLKKDHEYQNEIAKIRASKVASS
jgi:hypothetical protein